MHLTTSDLSLALDGKQILQQISLDVADKQFVGVIGPNGSGKSTLLKTLYRVLKPNKGEILFDGVPQQKIPLRDSARQMAVVAQHNDNTFDFTVHDMVLFGRAPYKKFFERDNAEDHQIAKQALQQVGMAHAVKRSMASLSGGERQRVVLARALAQRAECLILDEPTNHLDIQYQLQIMSLVKQFDVTVVAAIHDLNLAAQYCDKLYVLKDGKVLAFGTPGQVLTVELIQELYQVESKVMRDPDTGLLNILFLPPTVAA